jgi:hypothetical protein
VTQAGGTLVVRRDGTATHLVHNGATVPIGLVMMNWPTTEERDGGATIVRMPMMEPGAWTLCSVAPGSWEPFRRTTGNAAAASCTAGALDPYGALVLGGDASSAHVRRAERAR